MSENKVVVWNILWCSLFFSALISTFTQSQEMGSEDCRERAVQGKATETHER
jgi:hypothetical protein